ncbi:glycoside hydrolase family 140 protein [Emticicia sp. 21SJ11W-3]|uniref:glycoside hydrolase family 140 protein n=1 Tax=Emticicia sp. 21SJ11W-3 TaxID=2916755 RepID=UPI0038D3A179
MKFSSTLIYLLLLLMGLGASGQSFSVSENKRFILKDGKPFFWLGDTAWELFHRLNREDADYYLKKRAAQHYTVIQAVALAEFDGLNVPNPYGDKPLINNDPSRPNEAYFRHVDYVIDKAAEYGLIIGFLPTWGDKLNKSSWGKGPEVFNTGNARIYGKWLAERYKHRKNIIWILGGDRNPRPNTNDVEVWRAMAAGITEGAGGNDKALITYHPQPNREGASEWFHDDTWFDFNMFQNGHCRDTPIYDHIKGAYDRPNTKPVIDGEPIYEDHPVCFNAHDLGTTNAYDVRKYAYLDVFAGAFGHSYGCHDIWQMYSPDREAVNNPHIYWQQAIDLPGAKQMQWLRKLIESRPFLDRVPDQSLIVENNLPPAERIQATRGQNYAFVYTAVGNSFTVNLGKISGLQVNAYWFDPRTGKTEAIARIENKGTHRFTPPRYGYGQDWVLILDDAGRNFPNP